MVSSSALISARWPNRSGLRRSSNGITRSLQTMVLSAMVSTMTMPVAADSPPINTRSVSAGDRSRMGRASTNISGSTSPPGKCRIPAKAMGRTKTLMARRYKGNSQMAFFRWFSSMFSTTAIWNWRGRSSIENIDSTISEAHEPKVTLPAPAALPFNVRSAFRAGTASARPNRSPKPS